MHIDKPSILYRDICFRCHRTWDSLPEQLRYSTDYRDDSIPTPVRLMLIVLYLAYLYNDFLIQRLLVQQDPEAQSSLLEVSSTILSTVLAFCALREDTVDLRPDFVWTVSTFYSKYGRLTLTC
jgi:hypothetical protein